MNFQEYQQKALETDQVPHRYNETDEIAQKVIPLLGLAGEAGELLSEYKKYLRDGESHKLFKERVEEELGDLLWYVSNVASKFDLALEDIARKNLFKTHDRWGGGVCSVKSLDADFEEGERFPRKFNVELRKETDQAGATTIQPYIDGVRLGNSLTDNFPGDDGYRFHDVFHLAYVAVLGWSPVIRKLMGRKRRQPRKYDEVEDGGRAIVIDEAIVALAFDYAADRNFLLNIDAVDFQLLKTIERMTAHLEVSERSAAEWEKAILNGFDVWRQVVANDGGKMLVDLDARTLTFASA